MLIAIGTGLLSFSLIIILAKLLLKDKIALNKRLDRLTNKKEDEKTVNVQHERKKREIRLLTKLKIVENIETQLISAGILMRGEEFLIMWIMLIFLPAGFTALVFQNGISAASLIVIGVIVPIFIVKRAKNKRLDLFTVQLSDALITLSNCLRSGLSLIQGIESISREMPDPIAREFGKVYKEINFGVPIDKALNNLTERVRCEELDLIVSAILIQREVGGNLSAILDNVAETIRDRLKVKAEIKVITATGRMSGYVIGFLPLGILLILTLISPDYIAAFFETEAGTWMLAAAVSLEVFGFLLIRKIVNVKY